MDHFRWILRRDLEKLEEELDLYPSDEAVWELASGIRNSGGTLVLHVAGNLLHYVGSGLGGSDYVRDRDREFSERGRSRKELRARLGEASEAVDEALSGMQADRLREPFPNPPEALAGASTERVLLYLASHLAYHLGQVSYHRRLTGRA